MRTVALGAITLFCATAVHAQDYKLERGYPAPDASRRARNDADFQRAVIAYRFWCPSVSNEGIFNGSREAGIQDNESILIEAVVPNAVAFTANSDTPYGAGVLDLRLVRLLPHLRPGGSGLRQELEARGLRGNEVGEWLFSSSRSSNLLIMLHTGNTLEWFARRAGRSMVACALRPYPWS